MSKENQIQMLHEQIDDILKGIKEAKENDGENFTIKQLEKKKKELELKLEKLNKQDRKDNVITFEELGVDRIFVDEAHYYKNLFLYTKMRNVGGIAQTEAQKSSDLYMKCRYLDKLTNGKGVIFATGTPISNSMVEMYTMQRYLQYETLEKHSLQNFDAWASTFGETTTAIELNPEGTGYRAKTRFAKFYNLPELMSMFKEVADIQTADMLDLPVPKANIHKEAVKPSEIQEEMVKGLGDRAEKVRNKLVDSKVDNMLKITNDGRKLALDQRLANPLLEDFKDSKIAKCAENVYNIWEKHKDKRLAQLVFCDLSTPKSIKTAEELTSDEYEFTDAYNDLKRKLILKGIPPEEIAFIHEANTEEQKDSLFAKVRNGQIRVLIGSTQKMGAGTNCQDKLIALHHLDCPWRPSDIEQRNGRIIRQGNQNPEVDIFFYVTEKTFDAYLFQLVENKQKFISQIMTSKTPVRSAEDIDETALNYAEIKALAAGNPLILEKTQLEADVGKLKILKQNHLNQIYQLEDKIAKFYPQQIQALTESINGLNEDIGVRENETKANKDGFSPMIINGKTYTEKKEAGTKLLEECKKITSTDIIDIGKYRGFNMKLQFDSSDKNFTLFLKNKLSHKVELGNDVNGNITRIDNVLSSLEESLKTCQNRLQENEEQLENAKNEVNRTFDKEDDLKQKQKRLNEVNSLLNLNEKDNEIIDDVPDDEEKDDNRNDPTR